MVNTNARVRRKEPFKISIENKKIIDDHLLLADKYQFPKKTFNVGGKEKQYCSYLFFTSSIVNIPNRSDKVAYICMLCPAIINAVPSDSRNIKRHLELLCKNKNIVASWMKAYNVSLNIKKKRNIR